MQNFTVTIKKKKKLKEYFITGYKQPYADFKLCNQMHNSSMYMIFWKKGIIMNLIISRIPKDTKISLNYLQSKAALYI